jgi:creatinine amidohydrolase/Fe(II)-dependent formamide hydrolase-like protein
MDDYSKTGVVGRGATKSSAELGEKIFEMVVEELVPMVLKGLKEENPRKRKRDNKKAHHRS